MNKRANGVSAKSVRFAAAVLICGAILAGAMGAGCDIPAASSEFREAAGSSIEQGIRSIIDGILDGIFAVIDQAGDGTGG